MRVTVVGSGYVGLVASACLAEIGHHVTCVDNDRRKVSELLDGKLPIHEEYLPELLARHAGTRLTFSTQLPEAVSSSSIVFIAVGTPPAENGDGEADLSYVESVSRELSGALEGYKVVVEKSTVPVYTCEWIRRVITMNSRDGLDFDVASNPEFLREGTAVSDFLYPDRIVIGADTERAAEVLRQLYEPLTSGRYYAHEHCVPRPTGARIPPPMVLSGTKEAELIKHTSNAFLATKISFINAVANLCEAVGADIEQVCAGVGLDSRIGPRFLRAGIGFGGSCFPKDLLAFRAVAQERGCDFGLLDEVMKINQDQRQRFLKKIRQTLWTLKGKRLAVLGLAFKGGTDDIRESPAIEIIGALIKEGCAIQAYDPAAMKRAGDLFASGEIDFKMDPYKAARGCDALLILTDWQEFATLDLARIRSELKYPIILDGRNLYDPQTLAEQGFQYVSVGRRTVLARMEVAAAVASH